MEKYLKPSNKTDSSHLVARISINLARGRMTVLQLIKNLFTDERTLSWSGLALAGSLNIESGTFEIKSENFASCEDCESQTGVVRNCRACGRKPGNNLQFLAGKGDGVYAGVGLLDGLHLFAAVYVFDDRNNFANSVAEDLLDGTLKGNRFEEKILQALFQYSDLEGYEVGSIRASFEITSDLGFVAGDLHSGLGNFATVDHPFADGEYITILFSEPILIRAEVMNSGQDFDTSQWDGGFEDAIRPRVALILDGKYASKVLKNIQLRGTDWDAQAQVWNSTQVESNIGEGNAGVTNLMNGLLWDAAAGDQAALEEFGIMEYTYGTRAMGFFVQGALCGNENCVELAKKQIKFDPDLMEDHVMSDCLKPRGLVMDESVMSILGIQSPQEAPSQCLASFCSQCGHPFTENLKFCSSCGAAR